MTVWTAAGIALVLFLIVGVGLFSGKRVKGASDFVDGGKKAGPFLVCGTIMGSLVINVTEADRERVTAWLTDRGILWEVLENV